MSFVLVGLLVFFGEHPFISMVSQMERKRLLLGELFSFLDVVL